MSTKELHIVPSAAASSDQITRVMSPSSRGTSLGFLLGYHGDCPVCRGSVTEPVVCSGCGSHGHPACIQAEMFQSLPFCGTCMRRIMQEYCAFEDRRRREEWKKHYETQLSSWKNRVLTAVGVSSVIGAAVGGATTMVAASAVGFARGAVQAVTRGRDTAQVTLEDIPQQAANQHADPTGRVLAASSPAPPGGEQVIVASEGKPPHEGQVLKDLEYDGRSRRRSWPGTA